ncbi:hypothetical protein PVAP13_5NG516886 [Panicum virgatum]|uniref:Uncharacterized protein n=1 Tax=Panicum virgatum TaxID=38727 RepID=A0A8T0S616_PANVG|nr:hypothetical protein PVAP13_5NG516886 [Panicum virgatum]
MTHEPSVGLQLLSLFTEELSVPKLEQHLEGSCQHKLVTPKRPTTKGVEKSQDDALKRDHDAPDANVAGPSTGHGFHQGTNLHARDHRRVESTDRCKSGRHNGADSPRQTRRRRQRRGGQDQQRRPRGVPRRRPQQGHDAQGAIVAGPQHGHGFHREHKNLHARASGGTLAAASDCTTRSHAAPIASTAAPLRPHAATSAHGRDHHSPRGGERPPRPPSHRSRAGRRGGRGRRHGRNRPPDPGSGEGVTGSGPGGWRRSTSRRESKGGGTWTTRGATPRGQRRRQIRPRKARIRQGEGRIRPQLPAAAKDTGGAGLGGGGGSRGCRGRNPPAAVLEHWRTSARVLSGGGEVEGGREEGPRGGGAAVRPGRPGGRREREGNLHVVFYYNTDRFHFSVVMDGFCSL